MTTIKDVYANSNIQSRITMSLTARSSRWLSDLNKQRLGIVTDPATQSAKLNQLLFASQKTSNKTQALLSLARETSDLSKGDPVVSRLFTGVHYSALETSEYAEEIRQVLKRSR